MTKQLLDFNPSCHVSYIRAKETHSLARVPILAPCIIWVRQGTKKIYWETGEETIHQGSLMVLPANSQFYMTNIANKNGYLAEVLSLSNQLIDDFLSHHTNLLPTNQSNLSQYGLSPNKHITNALDNLIQSIHDIAPISLQQGYANVLLLAFADSGHLSLFQPTNSFSQQVQQLILQQPQQPWTVDLLANHFNMSSATFRRYLSKEKQGIRKILDDVRLGLALSKVQQTELTIDEITSIVGYQCPSQFSAKFKRRFGVSPSILRKSL